MVNLGKMIKDEIYRIARKQALAEGRVLRKAVRKLGEQNKELRVSLKALEAALRKGVPPATGPGVAVAEAPASSRPYSAKTIKALRRKLKLTQGGLAKLVGVSAQSVVLWEHKPGRIKLRAATVEALNRIRRMGRREAKVELESHAGKTRGA